MCVLSECSTIFKMFCTSLNSRKLLWLPQEMGRGNRVALARRLRTEDRWARDDGRCTHAASRALLRRIRFEEPLGARSRDRADPGRLSCGPFVEMTLIPVAAAALLCCSLASANTLDPAGKNVCRGIRYPKPPQSLTHTDFSSRVKSRIFNLSKNTTAECFTKIHSA